MQFPRFLIYFFCVTLNSVFVHKQVGTKTASPLPLAVSDKNPTQKLCRLLYGLCVQETLTESWHDLDKGWQNLPHGPTDG